MSASHFDVIVVGAGIAGLLAALQAARRGKRVVILSKVQPFLTHSRLPEGGVNASLKTRRVFRVRPDAPTTLDLGTQDDDWRRQAEDVWNDGFFLSDWDALETACKEGPEIIQKEFSDLLDKDESGEVLARSEGLGLWADRAQFEQTAGPPVGGYIVPGCLSTDCDCGHFNTQAYAQWFMENYDPYNTHALDGAPVDGFACESLP